MSCITVQQRLITRKNTINNGFERSDKKVYGEMSVRQKVSWRSVLTAKCPHGEMSLRQSVRKAKCSYCEMSYGEMSHGKKSYHEKSGHELFNPNRCNIQKFSIWRGNLNNFD